MDRLHISHSPIPIDLEVRNVTGRAFHLIQQYATYCCRLGLFVSPGLEIVKEVEFEMVNDADRYLVFHAIAIRVSRRVCGRGSFYLVNGPVKDHAGGSGHTCSTTGRGEIRVHGFKAHFGLKRADEEFAYRDSAAVREERANPKVRIDPHNLRGVDDATSHCDRPETNPFTGELF